ncbi:hypothetical protein [Streptomyces sp. SP17KL33]|uniref:hypothetical protein n=1 Tax=Streptomyces sp. SP17KL33 TaxID=3002534 RepID=UPI002E7951B6|nr:hypothetical protein [Streptomyces sp. SP17KL33]MEE1838210.1 hypothetical protein [Streptomyces sp. SP17KL33]
MSIQSVLDGIATYFGGPYDATTRTYRSSPLSGVGVVRRAWAKRDDHAEYFHGMQPGARTGCQIVVYIARSSESRFAVAGATGGHKNVVYEVQLCCYLRSNTPYAEDAQDDVYALRDALVEHLRADRTLGGAVFQAGEAVDGGIGTIDFEYGQPETKAELTKSFVVMTFPALEIVQA